MYAVLEQKGHAILAQREISLLAYIGVSNAYFLQIDIFEAKW